MFIPRYLKLEITKGQESSQQLFLKVHECHFHFLNINGEALILQMFFLQPVLCLIVAGNWFHQKLDNVGAWECG